MVQAMPQPARTHGGDAAIEQGEQRWRRFSAQGFADLQIASGSAVQTQKVAFVLDREPGDMSQGLHLCRLGVLEQGSGGRDAEIRRFEPETRQITGAEMGGQQLNGR